MNNYIIRGSNSGVFYGQIKERNGQEVTMTNVRRIWYWDGAASLSQLAIDGVSHPEKCKISMVVNEMIILDAVEIIPCTENASLSLDGVPVWKI